MTRDGDSILCVVDASVAIKWYVEEVNSGAARALLQRISHADSRFYVPNLFYVETANVLWTCVRKERITAALAEEAMATLLALPLISTGLESLASAALVLSLQFGISAYDASYVVLAAQLDAPLITADDRLQRKLNGSFDVRLLSEFTF